MKKFIAAFCLLTVSATSYADSLVCLGMESKTVLTQITPLTGDPYVLISVWSRSYEQARIPDMFQNGVSANSVKDLIKSSPVIQDSNFKESFKLDLRNSTVDVSNGHNRIQETVNCKGNN